MLISHDEVLIQVSYNFYGIFLIFLEKFNKNCLYRASLFFQGLRQGETLYEESDMRLLSILPISLSVFNATLSIYNTTRNMVSSFQNQSPSIFTSISSIFQILCWLFNIILFFYIIYFIYLRKDQSELKLKLYKYTQTPRSMEAILKHFSPFQEKLIQTSLHEMIISDDIIRTEETYGTITVYTYKAKSDILSEESTNAEEIKDE